MNAQPHAPAPGYPQPSPPAKKKGMSGGKIACLVIAGGGLLMALFAGGMCAMFWNAFSEPREAGHAFLADIRKGNYDAAYKKTATEFRDAVTLDEWDELRSEDLLTEIRESDDATFNSINISNRRGCLSGSLSPRGGAINLTIVQEGEKWRVAGISRKSCRD